MPVTVQAKAPTTHPRVQSGPAVMRAIKGDIGAAAAEKWNSVEKIAIKQKDSSRTLLIFAKCGSKRVLFVAEARIKRRC
jgi:hypothetical protein